MREPLDAKGEKSLQTTKALELNYSALRVVFLWMKTPKISIKQLEPQACSLYDSFFNNLSNSNPYIKSDPQPQSPNPLSGQASLQEDELHPGRSQTGLD